MGNASPRLLDSIATVLLDPIATVLLDPINTVEYEHVVPRISTGNVTTCVTT